MTGTYDAFLRGQESLFQEVASRWNVPSYSREEVVQELRLLAFEILKRGKYDPAKGSFAGFFRPAAYRRLLGLYRTFNARSNVFRKSVSIEIFSNDDSDSRSVGSITPHPSYEQNGHAWREFLSVLRPDEANACWMFFTQGLGVAKIAEAMWWTPGKAKRILDDVREKAVSFFHGNAQEASGESQ